MSYPNEPRIPFPSGRGVVNTVIPQPNLTAIVILGEASMPVAQQIQATIPGAVIYGLVDRTQSADLTYTNFGEFVREIFQNATPVIGICAAGILIRTLAPLLNNKYQEPPVLAIAEDGSAVVPLLGGLQGVNDLARQIAAGLKISPAITTSGEIRFGTALLSPPPGYRLLNPDHAKTFIADLLAGATVKLLGSAAWLENSNLPLSAQGNLTIQILEVPIHKSPQSLDQSALTIPNPSPEPLSPSPTCLVYELTPQEQEHTSRLGGKLAIVGIGPGAAEWMSPEVRSLLQSATDWVGYKTYLHLVASLWQPGITRHESDNRVELDRATAALNLAAQGRSVIVVSSGDAGIYAMAAAVFEVLDQSPRPEWAAIEIQVAPGISAMQAAAAAVGAPLGHDFCVISLSDILKPWEVITQRLVAVAEADLVIAIYNPVSQQRTWQLAKAQEILLQWRSPNTPVVLARNLGRSGQTVQVKTLGELTISDADMRTIILIGSSKTRMIQQGEKSWVYTPRHY